MPEAKRVLIIGGGISGLSCAYYLQQQALSAGVPVEITLCEASEKLGGKIQTITYDDCVLEKGPDSFLARKQPIIDLSRELELESEWVGLNPDVSGAFILHDNRLHPIPKGMVLGIPTRWLPFAKSELISAEGKIRALQDLFLPSQTSADEDISLGAFLEKRLGREIVERITEPLLSGIYAGDTHQLSLRTTFPQFQQVESRYESLIRGMGAAAAKQQQKQSDALPDHLKQSMFLTFRGGLQTLVNRLHDVLSASVSIQTNTRIASLKKQPDHAGYRVDNETDFDAVCLATPAPVTAKLLEPLLPARSLQALQSIYYVSVANVIFVYNREDITIPEQGTGFLVPKSEGRHLTACTWTSIKWPHTAPSDKVVIRCYVGRRGEESIVHWSDNEIIEAVKRDIHDFMPIQAPAQFQEVTRWHHSMPQYPVGHVANMQQLYTTMDAHTPQLFLCGASYAGVGLPDCIEQGKKAAKRILESLI